MAILSKLEEDEKYLHAILSDPSGCDLAEFLWEDDTNPYGVFRLWPYQWKWFRCMDPLQIDQAARSVGKTLSIRIRTFAFPFLHPGQEMLLTAPELIHLDPILNQAEYVFRNIRLGREMLPKGRNQGIRRRPFEITFLNGARITGRIPHRDGTGVKGVHPLWLEQDEAQDTPEPGWTELIETLKRGEPDAVWRSHGVTRGVRDYFFKLTQPSSGWRIHHLMAMHRPTWTSQERTEKIELYGSRDNPDYKRNILGQHGDSTSPLFVLHRLMACADSNEESDYNTDEYCAIRINAEQLADMGGDIVSMLDFPERHRSTYKTFWVGMDIGLTQAPSEILVFAEYSPAKGKPSKFRLLTRVHLERISHPDQVRAILHMIYWYQPKAFTLDSTGIGLNFLQDLQAMDVNAARVVKGYNFSEKILIGFDQNIEVDEFKGDPIKDAGMWRIAQEHASDMLRDFVDKSRLELPWDRDLLSEFQGQTYVVIRDNQNIYGKRSYSKGKYHALDASKMAVLGMVQQAIEEFTKEEKFVAPPTIILDGW